MDDGQPSPPEDSSRELMLRIKLRAYFLEKALRAGTVDMDLGEQIEGESGIVYDVHLLPDVRVSLLRLRLEIIDEFGVDPETVEPPRHYGL